MIPRPVAPLIALALSACGPDAALWLTIEAPLIAGEDCDAARIEVTAPGGERTFDQTYDLTLGPPFPLTLWLETHNERRAGETLSVTATVLWHGDLARPWSKAQKDVSLMSGHAVELTLKLCDCPGAL